MRIVVCVKEVLDPAAVNNYALAGGLKIGADGKTPEVAAIPRLINGYDEQAIEAALRIKDAGGDCTVSVVSIGPDPTTVLRHASALGADDVTAIEPPPTGGDDHHVVAALLSAFIRSTGGAELVLCGRQASDDDQGVVPALIGADLDMAVITVAQDVAVHHDPDGPTVRVVRVTPDGPETVQARCPAVVTVSSELGEPRYPTMPQKMAARKVTPTLVNPDELPVGDGGLTTRARLVRQYVPAVKGDCEIIAGDGPAATAQELIDRLIDDKVLRSR